MISRRRERRLPLLGGRACTRTPAGSGIEPERRENSPTPNTYGVTPDRQALESVAHRGFPLRQDLVKRRLRKKPLLPFLPFLPTRLPSNPGSLPAPPPPAPPLPCRQAPTPGPPWPRLGRPGWPARQGRGAGAGGPRLAGGGRLEGEKSPSPNRPAFSTPASPALRQPGLPRPAFRPTASSVLAGEAGRGGIGRRWGP